MVSPGRILLLILIAGSWSYCAAQQTTAAPGSSTPAAHDQTAPPPSAPEEQIQKHEQSQRMLGVVPMFTVTSRQNAPPLTTREKFHLTAKQITDPFTFVAAGLQAGIGQATNEFSGYGQGAAGYGKRYGATFADQASGQFFSNAFYPTLFKEDPRYFRDGEGTVKHRIRYALTQEFVCHTDAGGRSFNWSNVLGAFTAGGLSNVYYPSTDRGLGLTMSRSGIALAYGSLGGLMQEFWPDIQRKFFHKQPQLPQSPAR
jgi:uncharacterized iron-regulated membrane protein